MTKQFEGKVALITGSASGIGRATAMKFAEQGAAVVVSDIDEKGGEQTLRMVKDCTEKAIFVKADISQEQEVKALVEKTIEAFGRLDYAINNAGVEGKMGTIQETPVEEFEKVININLKGVWLCMKYELPYLLKQGGAIVNLSSIAGLVGFNGLAPYVASKHAVVGLTKTAAIEYSKLGVRVNAISPAVIMTPMVERFAEDSPEAYKLTVGAHPIGRVGQVDEVAETVVWLCSEASSFVTGIVVPVDGGYTAQ